MGKENSDIVHIYSDGYPVSVGSVNCMIFPCGQSAASDIAFTCCCVHCQACKRQELQDRVLSPCRPLHPRTMVAAQGRRHGQNSSLLTSSLEMHEASSRKAWIGRAGRRHAPLWAHRSGAVAALQSLIGGLGALERR